MVTSADKLRAWGDVRENGKDKFVREVKNCKDWTGYINIR